MPERIRVERAGAGDAVALVVFDDPERRNAMTAEMGRALGFRGKLCIHPAQVAWAHSSFAPSAAEVERARRIVDAFDAAVATGAGSIAFEGQMIDEPLARRARAVLAAAEDA